MTRSRIVLAGTAALALGALLAGCGAFSPPVSPPMPTDTGVSPVGATTDLATGLEAPWSMLRLDDGDTLVSERDSGAIVRVDAEGAVHDFATVPGVVHDGEGGLLGLALLDAAAAGTPDPWLYAYLTTASDNRVVRMPLTGSGDGLAVGAPDVVIDGLPTAGNHNGGRIAFGPDGDLYLTVGDAGERDLAQDADALNGKILRVTPEGEVPDDNPFPGSPVYSMGHRNPQGIAWDASGQLYAAEFGQDAFDEFNRIEAGGNYGWPVVEGMGGTAQGFIDPLIQWPTDDASPSGLAYTQGTFFLASLKGQRLWVIHPSADGMSASGVAWFTDQGGEPGFGRLRDVTAGPDGTLWMLTNNTDGRGSPRDGDDRIVQTDLQEMVEG